MGRYAIEFIGTFFLVLTIGLTGNPLAIGVVLMVMVYMGGNISGAHYNPAVTLAILLRGKIDAKNAVMYWVVQLLGGFAAAALFFWFTGKSFAATPAPGIDFMKAAVAEVVFTFALVLVILNVATTKKAAGNSYYGLAIGFTVMAGAFAVGPISGAAFNPAVAASPIIFDTIRGGTSMQYLPMYLLGELLGAGLASITFRLTNKDEFAE